MYIAKLVLFSIFLFIWINILLLLKHNRMHFFVFLIGSLGLFVMGMLVFREPLEGGLNRIVTMILEQISEFNNMFKVYREQDILMQETRNGIVTMRLTYECSGIIEMLIFISLVSFFPFIKGIKKIWVIIGGGLFIIIANIIRIISILVIVRLVGVYSYTFAHNIVARIIFFILMVILYYYVFTKTQIRKQKVGGIR